MNKLVFCFFVLFFPHWSSIAQNRPSITLGSIDKWPKLGGFQISNNGRYVAYNFVQAGVFTMDVKSMVSPWQSAIDGASLVGITQKSDKVLFSQGDSLGIIDLEEPHRVQYLAGIARFQMLKRTGDKDMLLYSLKRYPDQLNIRDIGTGSERTYDSVVAYWAGGNGNVVALEMSKREEKRLRFELGWLDLEKNKLTKIWEGGKIEELQIGHKGCQCVFATSGNDAGTSKSIWVYSDTIGRPIEILNDQRDSLNGMMIGNVIAFNDESRRVFFRLVRPRNQISGKNMGLPLNIWSYKDAILQSEQLHRLKTGVNNIGYKAVFNLEDRTFRRLEFENESISSELITDKPLNYVLLTNNGGGNPVDEWNWNSKGRTNIYLLDLNSGSRRLIARDLPGLGLNNYVITYNENYVLYYDGRLKDYCSYRIRDGSHRNLTRGVLHTSWAQFGKSDEPTGELDPYPIEGYVRNTDAVIIYDQNDIYIINPENVNPVRNETSKCRKGSDWVFRIVDAGRISIVDSNEKVCLSVFNRNDKEASLTTFRMGSHKAIDSFHFQPYNFEWQPPLKARDTSNYIVLKTSAEHFPNLFSTNDFRSFVAVTNVYPERSFNWIRSELVTWRTYNGTSSQGILYKPENFDKKKKYPVIVHYYEGISDILHRYLYPEMSYGPLNVAFFVSNGFLVFEPDIHYTVGRPGWSAFNCVVSGVDQLLTKPYVDKTKIGLQGHSFGGFETNYIIAHSHKFAAAMSASGMSDFISAYGSIIGDGTSRQRQYELYRDRMGTTPWKRPDLYIENSPVLRADLINTPLLIMANERDYDVPFQQGVELFTAMRRLGKKVWMLQYEGQDHSVFGEAAKDLTLRMFQFFNHYLKGELPPKWMTLGVPAEFKGIDSGLELDSTGSKP